MAAIPWPVGVPQCPILNTVTEVPDRNVNEFKPEAGPELTRRRTSIPTEIVTADLYMTYAQYDLFRTWLQQLIKDGALTFFYKDPLEPGGPGSPPTVQIWKFVDAPRFRQQGKQRGVLSLAMRRLS